jgi:hypothetical protein
MIDQLRLVDRSFGFLPLPLTAFFFAARGHWLATVALENRSIDVDSH